MSHNQSTECHRELPKEDRHEQDREKWYERRGRYNGRDHDNEPYHEKRRYHDESKKFNPKLDILDFEGIMQPDDFLDWLNTVERMFEYCDLLEHKKVKLVAKCLILVGELD